MWQKLIEVHWERHKYDIDSPIIMLRQKSLSTSRYINTFKYRTTTKYFLRILYWMCVALECVWKCVECYLGYTYKCFHHQIVPVCLILHCRGCLMYVWCLMYFFALVCPFLGASVLLSRFSELMSDCLSSRKCS